MPAFVQFLLSRSKESSSFLGAIILFVLFGDRIEMLDDYSKEIIAALATLAIAVPERGKPAVEDTEVK